MKSNILIVDDEKEIANLLEIYLLNEDFTVFKQHDVKTAMDCIEDQKIDLAILDVMLPDGDGFTLCRKIRETRFFPIIMLTVNSEDNDKIKGLVYGADDYITKPFNPLEVVTRIKAQLRRHIEYNMDANKTGNMLTYKSLTINIDKHECLLQRSPIVLTPTEFIIITVLCQEKGNVVSSEQLFRKVWENEYFEKNNNTIATHIKHLREKMGDLGNQYIKTVWGVGYKLEE